MGDWAFDGEVVGDVVAQARVERGVSQYALADTLRRISGDPCVTRDYVRRWEQGKRIPTPYWRRHLAVALAIQPERLDRACAAARSRRAGPASVGTPGVALGDPPALGALRRALDAYDLPDDGTVRPIEDSRNVVARLVRWRLESSYHDLDVALPVLLPELHRAMDRSVGQHRSMVADLLVQSYRAIAPEHVRLHPDVRQLVGALVERRSSCTEELGEFARWIQPAAVSRPT